MDPNGARMVSPFQVEAKVPRCGPERRSSTNILLWFIIFIYHIILGIFCPTCLECLNRNIPELMIMTMFRWKSVVTFSTFLVKSINALGLANADWMGFLPGAETIWARWKKERLDATVFHCTAVCSSECVLRQIPCDIALLPSTRKGWGFAHAPSHCGNALCWPSLHSGGMERHFAFASFCHTFCIYAKFLQHLMVTNGYRPVMLFTDV